MIQDKCLLVIMIPYYIDEEIRRSTNVLCNKQQPSATGLECRLLRV